MSVNFSGNREHKGFLGVHILSKTAYKKRIIGIKVSWDSKLGIHVLSSVGVPVICYVN